MNALAPSGPLARCGRFIREAVSALARDLARGYAWIALLPHAGAGALLAAITFLDNPTGAVLGLAGALASWLSARCVGADAHQRPIAVFNGLLLGLLMGSSMQLRSLPWMLLPLACAFTGAATVLAGATLALRTGLGLYSAPFSLIAMAWLGLTSPLADAALHTTGVPALSTWLSLPARAMANLFFLHTEWAGWAVLLVMALVSRYYLLLLLGALAISAAVANLSPWASPTLLACAHTNAMLTMLLVGGLMSAPGFASASCASAAAALAAMLTCAVGLFWQAPMFSLPFVLTSWVALACMQRQPGLRRHTHAIPRLPELAAIHRRMANDHPAYRLTPALAIPFNGIWTVSQDTDGPHTHVGVLRHALDFIRISDGRSFLGLGAEPTDFLAFDQPVFAPASGEVVVAVSHLADNRIGDVDTIHHWGNHVVIRMEDGLYSLLAHLRMGSLLVGVGSTVRRGQAIACCGNSGRSPQPHLHLHVQTTPFPGGPTVPFTLANLWLDAGQPGAHHVLQALPTTGQQIGGAALPTVFPLALLPGRGLRYRALRGEHKADIWSLECTLTPDGRWQLLSSAGGGCIAAQRDGMFFCSERNSAPDLFLDAWIMACANVATSSDVTCWALHNQLASDSVSRSHRMRSRLLSIPAVAVLSSTGTRDWEESSQRWVQSAVHRQMFSSEVVHTRAHLTPLLGAADVRAQWGKESCTLAAISLFQRGDVGIPGWDRPVATAD